MAPFFFLVLACAFWGLSFPVIKALHLEQAGRLPGVGSEFLAAWMQVARFGLGAMLLLPLALRRRRPNWLEVRQAFWLAVWGGAAMAMQADGLAHTEASTSAFLTQAYCVLLPLIACLRLRRPPPAATLVATLLVVAGCAVLSGIRPGALRIGRGEFETLVAALLFTFQILTLENPRFRGNRSLPVTFMMCLGIAVLFVPVTALLAPAGSALLVAGASWPSFALVAVLAVFCTVGAYLLMNHWQPRISATEAGLIYTTEPVFAAFYVMFLPGLLARFTGGAYANEQPGLALIAGGGMILIANGIMRRAAAKPEFTARHGPAP